MDKTYRNAAIAGIVALVLLVPYIALEILKSARGGLSPGLLTVWAIIASLSLATFILFMVGFRQIGRRTDNGLMEAMTYVLIAFSVLEYAVDMTEHHLPERIAMVFRLGLLFVYGVAEVLFGISCLRLKTQFGTLGTSVAALEIVSGACLMTVLLAFFAILLIVPLLILEVVLLFKADDRWAGEPAAGPLLDLGGEGRPPPPLR